MSGIKGYSISGLTQLTPLSISTTEATLTVGAGRTGDYVFWTDVECYIKVGAPELSAVTTSNGIILYPGAKTEPVRLTAGDVIRAITASGTGTLKVHEVGVMR